MKVEVDVLGSPSLISLMVSVDVKHHEIRRGLVVVVRGVMRGGGGGGTIFQRLNQLCSDKIASHSCGDKCLRYRRASRLERFGFICAGVG